MIFPKESEKKRVYLRIPLRLSAKIFLNESDFRNVTLLDLSTNGLSFIIDAPDLPSDKIDIRFRLRPFSRIINITLQLRNRAKLPEGLRVGCSFLGISEEDQRLINKYIFNFIGISFPVRAINFVAFFCVIDAAWRLFAYSVNFYYSQTEFGRNFQISSPPNFYGIALLLYAVFSLSSFIFSTNIILRKGKGRFLLSMLFLIPVFIFTLIRNIMYFQSPIWFSSYFFVKAFFWIQVVLVSSIGFSIVIATFSFRKINLILDIIEQHHLFIKQKEKIP